MILKKNATKLLRAFYVKWVRGLQKGSYAGDEKFLFFIWY